MYKNTAIYLYLYLYIFSYLSNSYNNISICLGPLVVNASLRSNASIYRSHFGLSYLARLELNITRHLADRRPRTVETLLVTIVGVAPIAGSGIDSGTRDSMLPTSDVGVASLAASGTDFRTIDSVQNYYYYYCNY